MRSDDAADAIAELRQHRRLPVLDLLPTGHRNKILTLLGFSPSSAGGLMSTDVMTCPQEMPVGDTLRAVAAARALQQEALHTVHALDGDRRLAGIVTVIGLVRADPTERLSAVLDTDLVRVSATTDAVDIALLMADYNLVTVPVVDEDDRVLGVVTIDDVPEATIPDDWRRREPATRPPSRAQDQQGVSLTSGPPGDTDGSRDV